MYRDLAAGTESTATLIARAQASVVLGVDGAGERAAVELLSGNVFATLGVTPALGRFFSPADDTLAAMPVVVLSHAYWERRFNSAPAVVGQQVRVNTTRDDRHRRGPAGLHRRGGQRSSRPCSCRSPRCRPPGPRGRGSTTAASAGSTSWPGWRRASAPTAAKAALDVRYRQVNEEELVAVPAFAAASDLLQGRLPSKTLTFHDASRGLSDLRRPARDAGPAADGHGGRGPAHRLRQRGQPAAGACHRTAARDERASRARRHPVAPGAPDAGRRR